MKKEINKDRLLGVIMLLISLLFAYYTTGIKQSDIVGDPGPRLFPYISCFMIGGFSLVLIVRRNQTTYKQFLTKEQWIRYWKLFSLYVLNYLLLHFCGYKAAIPATLCLTCFLFSKGSGVAHWKKILYVVAVSAAIIIIYTKLLGVNLPAGKLKL